MVNFLPCPTVAEEGRRQGRNDRKPIRQGIPKLRILRITDNENSGNRWPCPIQKQKTM